MEIETFEIHVILCVGDRFSWMNVYRNFLIFFSNIWKSLVSSNLVSVPLSNHFVQIKSWDDLIDLDPDHFSSAAKWQCQF